MWCSRRWVNSIPRGRSGRPAAAARGASSKQDGVSLIHGTLGVGQFRPGPVEIHETEFPMRVVRFDVRADSGGPAQFRGGLGCTREYQLLEGAGVGGVGK